MYSVIDSKGLLYSPFYQEGAVTEPCVIRVHCTECLVLCVAADQPPVNGETNGGEDGGSAVRKQDIIVITGRKDLCEKAKEALLVSMEVEGKITNLNCFSDTFYIYIPLSN